MLLLKVTSTPCKGEISDDFREVRSKCWQWSPAAAFNRCQNLQKLRTCGLTGGGPVWTSPWSAAHIKTSRLKKHFLATLNGTYAEPAPWTTKTQHPNSLGESANLKSRTRWYPCFPSNCDLHHIPSAQRHHLGTMPLSVPVTAVALQRSVGKLGRAAVACMQELTKQGKTF